VRPPIPWCFYLCCVGSFRVQQRVPFSFIMFSGGGWAFRPQLSLPGPGGPFPKKKLVFFFKFYVPQCFPPPFGTLVAIRFLLVEKTPHIFHPKQLFPPTFESFLPMSPPPCLVPPARILNLFFCCPPTGFFGSSRGPLFCFPPQPNVGVVTLCASRSSNNFPSFLF